MMLKIKTTDEAEVLKSAFREYIAIQMSHEFDHSERNMWRIKRRAVAERIARRIKRKANGS